MTIHFVQGFRVRTSHECPPMPVRDFDWSAVLDNYYDGASDTAHGLCTLIGTGPTEEKAIDDLLELVDELAKECA